jgi:hypothetical protein
MKKDSPFHCLAEKVITLMTNEESQENMGRAGRKRAKEFD